MENKEFKNETFLIPEEIDLSKIDENGNIICFIKDNGEILYNININHININMYGGVI